MKIKLINFNSHWVWSVISEGNKASWGFISKSCRLLFTEWISGLKYVKPSYATPLKFLSSIRLLGICSSKFWSNPSLLISLSMKVLGGGILLFSSSSKLIYLKNLWALISLAPEVNPSLSFGFILNSYFNNDLASSDRVSGRGTGLLVIFFKISCLFLL